MVACVLFKSKHLTTCPLNDGMTRAAAEVAVVYIFHSPIHVFAELAMLLDLTVCNF